MSSTIRRRNNAQQSSSDVAESSDGSNNVVPSTASYNRPVFKLGIVSISMAVLPIATFYGTLGRVFDENNTTASAISAIVVTNIILIGYIFMALMEKDDKIDESRSTKESNRKDS
ncbi:hypothetical protein BY996DRAFT_7630870 [Phakopsora pachyrhizi]|uniref:Vacuolar ATPase assembly integral membrane protein VMA21 n=1 Tax=Phakopsora pachyrhizi TaxID=170000 RepID=A0AAV0BLH4_PHAPC|nr:hypothetical protein BY996DRAFT_8119370 [Phakopsora pachyrhizi]KAI8448079.1 hypothetical protein BY996DRAFT_7630870 [Phakopsora pachyrhizi]CAH7688155.1 hypothetical protein PPACK8108_LOCUS23076 [Phakopsora pachyrhizi]